ncbi:MAG: hypothetical protein DRI90_15270 [Deltaproteobacteria bacterium]|nr:MAG: hypothetical protein DRI90_15270 [Deltaproteobacteria bacterium]
MDNRAIMFRWQGCAICLATLLTAAVAEAQPAIGATVSSDARYAGDQGFLVKASAAGGGKVQVDLQSLGPGLKAKGAPLKLYRGDRVLTTLALRQDAVLVPLINGGRQPFVRFAVLARGPGGEIIGSPRMLDATASRQGTDSVPTAVIACSDPQGFTVLWQEQVIQAGRADARTYLARIAPDGRWLEPAKVVQVPWAIGAIAHSGTGYHLAIFYDGARPDQTRLCFVTLSAGGRPQQHPWWGTEQGLIDEVQLMPIPGGVQAYYRGGPKGRSLRSVQVTSIGRWGHEPRPSQDHGAIATSADFALRLGSGRQVEVVR